MNWLLNLLPGASKAVTDVAGAFAVNKEADAARSHEFRQSALSQYSAEFHTRANRTWFDSLVDGLNRLVRPMITLTFIGIIPAVIFWPAAVGQAFSNIALLPTGYWAVLATIITFYFGGRMQLKAQDFQMNEVAVAAASQVRSRSPNRSDRSQDFVKPVRSVSRVFLHCTASDHAHHDNIETIRDWHVNDNGWSDAGYHELITFNGGIEKGRPLERTPAAQKGHNTGTIAICLSGGQDGKLDAFTQAQFDALKRRCQQINDAYGGQITFHGHSEVAPGRACPVYDYKTILNLDEQGRMV